MVYVLSGKSNGFDYEALWGLESLAEMFEKSLILPSTFLSDGNFEESKDNNIYIANLHF